MKTIRVWWDEYGPSLIGFFVLCLMLGALHPAHAAAPTVQLSATPTTGISPLSVTLNWSSTDAVTCEANGGWSGSKPLSGTEVVTVSETTTFSLTCSQADGSATLTWTAPTQNTDNSPIPATGPGSLAGFKLYHAPTEAGVATATPLVVNDKTATTHTIAGLPAGQRYYGAKAFNVEGIDSDMSGYVNNVVTIPATTGTSSVTVSTKPKPPVLVAVQQTVYEVQNNPNGLRLGRNVGTVPLGTSCGETPVVETWTGTYYEVPLDAVTLNKMPKSAIVVVKCELSG